GRSRSTRYAEYRSDHRQEHGTESMGVVLQRRLHACDTSTGSLLPKRGTHAVVPAFTFEQGHRKVAANALEKPRTHKGTEVCVRAFPPVRLVIDETVRYFAGGTAAPSGIKTASIG